MHSGVEWGPTGSFGATGGHGRVLLALAVAAVALLIFTPSAFAAKSVHGMLGGPFGTGAGEFFQPRDVAVNVTGAGGASAGDVYVVDSVNNRIQVFGAAGGFKRMWGRNVIAPGASGDGGDVAEVCSVAGDCQGSSSSATSGGSAAGMFSVPQAVAVDQDTGWVYVSDRTNRRVQVFSATGTFLRAWGFDVDAVAPGTGFEVCTVAADCKDGLSGNGVGQIGNDSNNSILGLAVTPGDGNPGSGNVYLADTQNQRVNVYNLDGSAPSSFGSSSNFGSDQPRQIAVDSRGIVYASDSANSAEIDRYDSLGVNGPVGFLAPITAATLGGAAGTAGTAGLEVDPDSDGAGPEEDVLYVLRDPNAGNTVIRQYGPLNDPGLTTAPTATDDVHIPTAFGTAVANGLGIDTATATLYVSSNSGTAGHGVYFLDDDGTTPTLTATTTSATAVGSTSATLGVSIDAGSGLARYTVEVSADGVVYSTAGTGIVNATGPQPAAVAVTGLQPNTSYRYRVSATKALGPNNVISTGNSSDLVFLTDSAAPEVTTLGSAERTDSSVQLRGYVDANGSSTTYRFEYGPAGGSFDTLVPVPNASVGSGNADELVVQRVTGLLPETDYHYRIVATNVSGTDVGDPVSFTTEAVPGAKGPIARAYELVSPADKISGRGTGKYGVGDLAGTSGGAAAVSGERYLVEGATGSPLADCAFEYASAYLFSDRTLAGWQHRCPITRNNYTPAGNRIVNVDDASDDFSLLLWKSNGGHMGVFPDLEPFPLSWAIPHLSDWEGRWEVFGPTAVSQDAGLANTQPSGVVSGDGSSAVVTALMRGVAGPGDPTWDQVSGFSTYIDDVSRGLSDTFPGEGVRIPAGVCDAGTLIPSVDAFGDIAAQGCPAPVEYAPGQFRDGSLVSALGSSIGSQVSTPLARNVLSADGSRLFFLSPDPSVGPNSCSGSGAATSCPPQLYVREESSDGVVRTRWVSRTAVTEANGAAAEQDASLMAAVRFEGATPDGDKVFFRTAAPLTADDPNGGAPVTGGVTSGNPSLSSVDLFMYDFPDDPTADPSDGQLSRISRGPTGASDGGVSPANTSSPAGVDGAVRFLSQDGARVLFTSATPLPGVAAPSNGTITSPGSFPGVSAAFTNLYLYENVDGAPSWKFVARVPSDPSGIDSCASTAEFIADPIGSNADNTGLSATPSNCVRGTAGGELITFLTRGQLVLDDPDSSSLDVYGYDAEDGELVRISAAQGGAGGAYQCIDTPAPVSCHGDLGFGGRGSDVGLAGASGGRAVAFFQTKSRLVVEDTDLEYDVYQWERGGLSLLTPGTRQGAYLADNTADGRSVFFQTRDRLTWQDTDDAMDVYVARAGGGIPQPPLSSACVVLAGGCHDGGAGVVAVAVPETAFRVGDGDVSSRPRRTLTVGRLSRRALRIAARTGVLRVSVGVSDAGRVTAVAKARIGKRFRRVARGSVRLRGAGRARLRLSLDRVARQRIRHGRALRLTLRVSSAGARPRAMTVRLPGVRP